MDKESKCAQKWIKMDKNGFGEVEKMRQFCNNKIQHHENPYQHLVFRVVDDLNLNITTL